MDAKLCLKIILFIAIVGVIFSGYLLYYELFAGGCRNAIVSCGVRPVAIATLPACVYGLLMYTIILIVSYLGYRNIK